MNIILAWIPTLLIKYDVKEMSGFPPDFRARSLAALRDNPVDVLILGGGINGAGIARDLSLRKQQSGVGMSVALVDQGHFASGTSGKNSQLIHGGLRYLKYLKVGLVKESLRERAVLRRLAPHLVEPLALLMPLYSRVDKLKYMMGLTMYDQLAGDQNISKHREVSKSEIKQMEPALNTTGLIGGALFYDCKVHSARFVLENLFDAADNGVWVANYVKATPRERQADGSYTVEYKDMVFGDKFEGKVKKLVDATGAWSKPGDTPPRLVRGSHIILPRLTAEDHALAYFDEKGRIVFLIPWGSDNQLTLVGTTDVDHPSGPDDPHITKEEIDYLIGIVHRLYPAATADSIISAYSSLRPLADTSSASATDASREHKIWNTPDGILHIQGGKYTTYRQMSEEACNKLLKEVAPWLSAPCRTATESICGNTEKVIGRLRFDAGTFAEKYLLSRSEVEKIISEYGVHTEALLEMVPPEDYGPIGRMLYGRLAFAVQHEMALRLSDLLFVSTYFGYEQPWDAASLEIYAHLLGSWMGWDSARQAREIMLVLEAVKVPGVAR